LCHKFGKPWTAALWRPFEVSITPAQHRAEFGVGPKVLLVLLGVAQSRRERLVSAGSDGGVT